MNCAREGSREGAEHRSAHRPLLTTHYPAPQHYGTTEQKAPPPMAPPRTTDPDRAVAQKTARRVGVRVALLSAGMVLAGVLVLFGSILFDDRRNRGHGPGEHGGRGPDDFGVLVRLDVDDVVWLVPLIAAAVVVIAGVGAMLFARQAVKPLEDSMRRQRHFIGDASHELRTPLAVLDARIQQAQLLAGDDERLQPVLTELRADAQSMTLIVNDLLASVSQGDDAAEVSDLGASVAAVLADLGVLAREQGVELQCAGDSAGGIAVRVPRVALQRSLAALGDNALRHSPRGGTVTFALSVEPRWATLRIIDEGAGITGIEVDRVFERFARGAVPANADVRHARDSHGIGLSLVHDAATRCGGSVAVERTGSEGTVFRLRLPLVTGGSAGGGER